MEQLKERPIGILDSGLGGLTAVRELGRILPNENLVYFGDNANCPYGNRSKDDILKLTLTMLDFLQKKEVKVAAIACNTISTLIEEYRQRYEFPIVSIIESTCEYVAGMGLTRIGILATNFTVQQGHYNRLIGNLSPNTKVFSKPSKDLAMLVDEGRFDDPAMRAEIKSLLSSLRESCPDLKDIVLGCTHYPIVQDLFQEEGPGINFINPAELQANAVRALLYDGDILSENSGSHLDIFTSGEVSQYEAALNKLNISRRMSINTLC